MSDHRSSCTVQLVANGSVCQATTGKTLAVAPCNCALLRWLMRSGITSCTVQLVVNISVCKAPTGRNLAVAPCNCAPPRWLMQSGPTCCAVQRSRRWSDLCRLGRVSTIAQCNWNQIDQMNMEARHGRKKPLESGFDLAGKPQKSFPRNSTILSVVFSFSGAANTIRVLPLLSRISLAAKAPPLLVISTSEAPISSGADSSAVSRA